MSDSSQGPGWWLASDGKWYPPQQATPPAAPSPAPPPVPPPVPPAGPPPSAPIGPPPAKSGMSGLAKGCLIVFALFAFAGIAFVVLAATVLKKAVDDTAGGFNNCPIISSAQANDVLGGGYQADELKGLLSLGNIALDTRVLSDAPTSCWITKTGTSGSNGSNSSGRIVRVAKYEGGDAQSRFQAEVTKAKGTKEDKGGGLSVETMGYFNKTVEMGDEAFCTSTALTGSSGVLVRQGTTLVYVSTTPDDLSKIGIGDPNKGTMSYDDANCDVSQQLARKALGG